MAPFGFSINVVGRGIVFIQRLSRHHPLAVKEETYSTIFVPDLKQPLFFASASSRQQSLFSRHWRGRHVAQYTAITQRARQGMTSNTKDHCQAQGPRHKAKNDQVCTDTRTVAKYHRPAHGQDEGLRLVLVLGLAAENER